jgi:hypothetical protein
MLLASRGSGSGVSRVLPLDSWLFVNSDLTVHLAAIPTGEWMCMEARSWIDRHAHVPDSFSMGGHCTEPDRCTATIPIFAHPGSWHEGAALMC